MQGFYREWFYINPFYTARELAAEVVTAPNQFLFERSALVGRNKVWCVVNVVCVRPTTGKTSKQLAAISSYVPNKRKKAVEPVSKLQAEDDISHNIWNEDQCNQDLFKLVVFNG